MKMCQKVNLNAVQDIKDIQGKIMEGDCTHNPEDWNNKSIKKWRGDFIGSQRNISFIILGRNPKFGMRKTVGMIKCRLQSLSHWDLDL